MPVQKQLHNSQETFKLGILSFCIFEMQYRKQKKCVIKWGGGGGEEVFNYRSWIIDGTSVVDQPLAVV